MIGMLKELCCAGQFTKPIEGAMQVLGICDDSGEDARCHNSVCYLGLCTSVSDHLLYLGQHMYNGIPAC